MVPDHFFKMNYHVYNKMCKKKKTRHALMHPYSPLKKSGTNKMYAYQNISNTSSKIEDIGSKELSVVSTIASMAGYPELDGAKISASNKLK